MLPLRGPRPAPKTRTPNAGRAALLFAVALTTSTTAPGCGSSSGDPSGEQAGARKAKSFAIGPDWGKQHGADVPVRLRVEVPDDPSVKAIAGTGDDEDWMRFEFRQEGALAETIAVRGLEVETGEAQARMAALEKQLMEQVLPKVSGPGLQFHGTRPATVDGKNGVVVVGEFPDASGSQRFVGIVAVLLPEHPHGVLVVGHSVAGKGPVTSAQDVATKGALFDFMRSLKLSPA